MEGRGNRTPQPAAATTCEHASLARRVHFTHKHCRRATKEASQRGRGSSNGKLAASRKEPGDRTSRTSPSVDFGFVPARPHPSTFQPTYQEVSQSWITTYQQYTIVSKKKKGAISASNSATFLQEQDRTAEGVATTKPTIGELGRETSATASRIFPTI